MNVDELFTHTVALLPDPVRERLDGDFPLDWTEIEDAGTGAGAVEAARAHRRLPRPVEMLVHRLIRDVGIVPADVAGAVEREGAASAWIDWVAMEAEGESYLLRNERSGDVHAGVRPEAVVGYAVLGMELASVLHDAAEWWLEAGERHRAVREDERGPLGHCAVRMREHLRAPPNAAPGRRTAASVACTLERAWNSQDVTIRAALAGIRLTAARGAHAPHRSYYTLVTGYRLHACAPGEIRWLRALARRAGAGADIARGARDAAHETRAVGPRAGNPGAAAAGTGHAGSAEVHRGAAAAGAGTLELGANSGQLVPETEVSELARAASGLHEAVRARLAEAGGARVAEALRRLQAPETAGALHAEMWPVSGGRAAPAPQWLEELAASLLADTGAQTGEGLRTSSLRLDPARRPDGGHRATEVGTEASGHLAPVVLVEQVRLGLVFANDAWTALTTLRNAGKESEWALNGARTGSSRVSASERGVLETTRDIGMALGRIQQLHVGDRNPNALEQAAIVAKALDAIGPTARATAGWPGTAPVPNARSPEDIARIVTVAKALYEEIRAIADRFIVRQITEIRA